MKFKPEEKDVKANRHISMELDDFEDENYNHNVENYDRDLERDPRNEDNDEV